MDDASFETLTLEIRLILRVAHRPCIKMHRFASLFDFFDASSFGKGSIEQCTREARPDDRRTASALLENTSRATSDAPKCTKTHHFFDFFGLPPTD